MALVITVDGNPIREIDRAIGRLMNARAMDRYGRRIRRNTRDRTKGEYDPDGQPWVPLSEAYAATKRGPGMLRETGDLMRSIFVETRRGAAEIGTRIDYGTYHQQQEGETDSSLPQRQWLGVTNDDIREIGVIADEIWERAFDGIA